ncbi:MAG: class I SAM-dependent methyltransferase [Nitriliruptorales bacterium]|nr:class I SAM-dependent methyltransferase [Nitriliruptorales bacterium]
METNAFLRELRGVFDGDFHRDVPPAGPFLEIAADVEGLTTPHVMALLNVAVGHLGPTERYLEVGSYKGRSLLGAMAGYDHDRFTAIESFREFGMDTERGRRTLLDNLERWQARDRVQLLVGDAFDLLEPAAEPLDGPVGVYFYDGVHGALAHYLALGIVEPFLADEALVVVDDASWPVVSRQTDRYEARHDSYQSVLTLDARHERDPRWFNGVRILRYRRESPAPRRHGFDVRWRRLAHLRVYEPLWSWAWDFFPRHPRLTAMAKSALPMRGKRVGPKG